MADTYFGIGKLNFFLFLVIYMLVLGLVITMFNNTTNKEWDGKWHSPFGDIKTPENPSNEQTSLKKEVTNPIGLPNPMAPVEKLSNGFAKLGGIIMSALGIMWIGLTVNAPGMPDIVRIFMITPVVILLSVVILDIILDLIKAVKPDWL